MKNNLLNSALLFAAILSVGVSGHAGRRPAPPKPTQAQCVCNVMKQYNNSKAESLACLDELEADIQEGIDSGLPLSPIEIEARTQTCEDLEMTKAERDAAIKACSRR